MGRAPCCEKNEVKRGPWTPEEDKLLVDYIRKNGCGNWRTLPNSAGLQRCGKSCRLRWTNYLRPDIKRGRISFQEEDTIIQLHTILGNKWSAIAARLPGRTDNEIKNYWNTHIRKRLLRMGIDPVTHRYCTHLLQLQLDSIINSSHSITSSHTRLLRMQSTNYPETMSLASSLIQNHQINHQAHQLLQMQIPFQDFTFPANCFDHQLMHYGGDSFLQNFSGLEFDQNCSLLTEDLAAANYYGSGQPGMDPASSLDCFDLQSNISTPLSTPTMLQY